LQFPARQSNLLVCRLDHSDGGRDLRPQTARGSGEIKARARACARDASAGAADLAGTPRCRTRPRPPRACATSTQNIPLKGRKICGDPAEFWRQRLFAFELRRWGNAARSNASSAGTLARATPAELARIARIGTKFRPGRPLAFELQRRDTQLGAGF